MRLPLLAPLLALLLVLGTGALAALPATALAASGSATPTQAAPGTRVAFNATGFTPGERVDFWASPPGGGARPRYPSVEADASGGVVWSWDVAPGDPNGEWTMSARGVRSATLLAIPFSVVGSSPVAEPIAVSPPSGGPGTTFTFTATGLTPSRPIAGWLVDPSGASRDLIPGQAPNLRSDADGRLVWSWTAPADASGGTWLAVIRDNAATRELSVRFVVAAPPPAAPGRSVTPASGAPGTTFVVVAGGFTPGERVGSWLVSPSGASLDSPAPFLIADGQGAVTWRWTSPANTQAGSWQAVSQGRDSRVQVAIPFTVTGANAAPTTPQTAAGTVSPQSGTPDTTFTFTITGFRRTEDVFYWPTQPDGSVDTTRRTPIRTDGAGRAVLEWRAPGERAPQAGQWVMTFRGRISNVEVRVPYTITAPAQGEASVTPTSGPPGTTFTFRASGYNAIERLDTWLEQPDGTIVAGPSDARADRDGRVEWSWTAPANSAGGSWTMVARGQDSRRIVRLGITITDGAAQQAPTTVSPAAGPPGTTFTFTASGFEEGERVGYWLNLPDGTIVRFDRELGADRDGRISWSYTVPANGQRGVYTMAVRSSQNDRIDNDVSYAIPFTVQ